MSLRRTAIEAWRLPVMYEGAAMKVGVVFPQTELGGGVGAVRAEGEAVAARGYRAMGWT